MTVMSADSDPSFPSDSRAAMGSKYWRQFDS
jgi:hypothetical protein